MGRLGRTREATMDPFVALQTHFAHRDDPRVERSTLHRLSASLVSALGAVLAGASSWDDITLLGTSKRQWLATFLAVPHGMPSHAPCHRVFAALDPAQFEHAFTAWGQQVLGPQVMALAGQTVRGSRDTFAGTAALHRVSAWASTSRLVVAPVAVRDDPTLPEVWARVDSTGGVVTLDAMGCQRTIAEPSVRQAGRPAKTINRIWRRTGSQAVPPQARGRMTTCRIRRRGR